MCCSNENAFDRRYITILVKTDVMESKFKQFYHYQQNEQWPYSLNTKKITTHDDGYPSADLGRHKHMPDETG